MCGTHLSVLGLFYSVLSHFFCAVVSDSMGEEKVCTPHFLHPGDGYLGCFYFLAICN
jgi:hypothetical protein